MSRDQTSQPSVQRSSLDAGGKPRRLKVSELLDGEREAILEHSGQDYRLRITARAASGGQLVALAAVTLAVAAFLSLSIGSTGITLSALPRVIAATLTGQADAATAREQLVLLDIRLPRLLLGAFVGAALAVCGAMMQGMFRNPLADPGLVGVASGAALAAVATIALGNGLAAPWARAFGVYALPFSAFCGGLGATTLLVAIVGRQGQLTTSTLLLAGIALGAFSSALTGLIAFASDDRELRDLTLWMLGSLSGASWPKVLAILPFVLLTGLVLPRLIRALNGLLLGEAEAFHLGIDVEATKRLVIVTTAAGVGAAVAVAGVVGFVGIVVPHLVRLLAGPDHRVVVPASALLGGALVLIGARHGGRPAPCYWAARRDAAPHHVRADRASLLANCRRPTVRCG